MFVLLLGISLVTTIALPHAYMPVILLLHGRRLMRHADKHQINSDETYGGRKHRNCHDVLTRIQYTLEYSRIMRKPIASTLKAASIEC